MEYQFDGGAIGKCKVELRTAGRHGFAVPKIFMITCLDCLAPVVTFRFTNNVVAGVTSAEITNATLCRIVIAQFLQMAEHDCATQSLDTTIPPFDGPVMNEKGVILTFTRLYTPRGGLRAAELRDEPHPHAPSHRHADESPDGH